MVLHISVYSLAGIWQTLLSQQIPSFILSLYIRIKDRCLNYWVLNYNDFKTRGSKLPWFSISINTPWQEYGKLYCLSRFPASYILFTLLQKYIKHRVFYNRKKIECRVVPDEPKFPKSEYPGTRYLIQF